MHFFLLFIHREYCRIEIDDGNSKHEDDDVDDDGTATKDSDSKPIDLKDTEFDRPSSSGKLEMRYYFQAWINSSGRVDNKSAGNIWHLKAGLVPK